MMEARTTIWKDVPTYRIAMAMDQLKASEKVAKKMGLTAPSIKVGEASAKRLFDEALGISRVMTVVDVEVTEARLTYEGWTFVALIDHQTNVVKAAPSAPEGTVREYQGMEPTCDHCGIARHRNVTIVVEHEDGTRKRLGKACVQKFIGGFPTISEAMWKSMEPLNLGDDDQMYLPTEQLANIDPLTFLTYATAMVQEFGYVKRDGGLPTKECAAALLLGKVNGPDKAWAKRVKVDLETYVKAQEIMTWIANEPTKTDFIANMQAAASASRVGKNDGILAYLPAAYFKAMNGEIQKTKEELPTADCPMSEEVTITGEVVSVQKRHTDYGTQVKMIVRDDRGFRVWGTVPSKIWDEMIFHGGSVDWFEGMVGEVRISFKAWVTRSDGDSTFGFYNRPKQAKFLSFKERVA